MPVLEPAGKASVRVGDIRLTYLPDGTARLDAARFYSPSMTPKEIDAHREYFDSEGRTVTTVGGILVQTGRLKILVDSGLGQRNVETPLSKVHGGALDDSLASEGISRSDIDMVVFTHLHIDHVGGAVSGLDGRAEVLFPRSTYAMAAEEWEWWSTSDYPKRLGIEDLGAALPDRVQVIEGEGEFAPGLSLIHTPGHTTGHSSIVVSSGGERAVIMGDVVHSDFQFENAIWGSSADMDAETARQSRERIFTELQDPATITANGHFSGFVFGRVRSANGRRYWVPGVEA
jgi:glyoxylase-like metal-dependent hydrolase (beta-lactamase superfamily II)